MNSIRLTKLIGGFATFAVAVIAVTLWKAPLPVDGSWWMAFATLWVLTFTSEVMALQITEGGTLSSMDFVPHLAAAVLLGPSGAMLLPLLTLPIFQVLLLDKPLKKLIYNTAQITLASTLAGWTFLLLGGTPSFTNLGFPETLLPFFAAALVYFGINTTAVALVISLQEDAGFRRTWSNIAGRLIGFDLVVSPVAYGVAYLDIQFGHIFLLLALIPLFGLRYTYGANLELQNLNTDLLRTLMRMVESQDPYTSGHSVRVSQYSRALADELGIGMAMTRNIERAALLHDLGKVDRAYREILVQEGPLSDKQRQLIEEHPERGVELLTSVRSLDNDILSYIKHHHERYDGTGYPDGIGGDNIPIGGRIIMVADTIDAMLTSRSYRDSLSPQIVRSELTENAGGQFDPTVVRAALDINLVERADRLIRQQKEANMDPVDSPVDLPSLDSSA